MAAVAFTCTNPNCQRQMSFDQEAIGTVQQCPYCSQRVIVPEFVQSDNPAAIVPMMPPPAAPSPSYPYMQQEHRLPTVYQTTAPAPQAAYSQQERHLESHTERKLNMGAGCFAMLAVFFAFFVLGIGGSFMIGSILPNFNGQFLWGAITLIGGLVGLAAFAFFGYFATETKSRSQGSDRR